MQNIAWQNPNWQVKDVSLKEMQNWRVNHAQEGNCFFNMGEDPYLYLMHTQRTC